MMQEESILNDTTLWYAVAVVVFLAFAILKGRAPILGWLDSEIARVRAELDEAKQLHAEAVATLDEYRNKQRDAQREAAQIVEDAKKDADRLRAEAKAELEASLARHEQLFLDRIKIVHEEAIDEVRSYIIEEALTEARGKLAKLSGSAEADKLVDRIIADIPKLQKSKAG